MTILCPTINVTFSHIRTVFSRALRCCNIGTNGSHSCTNVRCSTNILALEPYKPFPPMLKTQRLQNTNISIWQILF